MTRNNRSERRAVLATDEAGGFTLIEVLVVMVFLILLALLFLPRLVISKSPAHAIQCMRNTRQITLGWLQYPDENRDRLPTTQPVAGIMDWMGSTDNTNEAILVDRSISTVAKYVPNPRAWKCPADKTKGRNGQRVRSLSMNGAVNGSAVNVEGDWPAGRTYQPKLDKLSEIRNPVDVFVVIDEHPDSINDSLFMVDPGANPQEADYGWRDLPASHHKGGAGGVSFADGHCEKHRWEEEETRQRIRKEDKPWGANGLSAPGSEDVRWMFDKMPYLDREL